MAEVDIEFEHQQQCLACAAKLQMMLVQEPAQITNDSAFRRRVEIACRAAVVESSDGT